VITSVIMMVRKERGITLIFLSTLYWIPRQRKSSKNLWARNSNMSGK